MRFVDSDKLSGSFGFVDRSKRRGMRFLRCRFLTLHTGIEQDQWADEAPDDEQDDNDGTREEEAGDDEVALYRRKCFFYAVLFW